MTMKIKKTVATTTKNNTSSKAKGAQPTVAAKASAPVAAKAAPAKGGKADVAAEPRNGINTGKSTGIRVMLFQDMTLATNDQAKRPAPLAHIPGQLTDTELAKVWREEFPSSRAVLAGRIDESIVRGVRNLYNAGTSGHGTPGQTHTSKPWVLGDGGKRSQTEYSRVRKVANAVTGVPAKAAKVTAEQATADTKAAARKAVKVVVASKSAKAGKGASQRRAAA
jgi:hypothetical protein